ncbi:MAG: electron transport complex subunit RsxG [Gammaproteobacteria bacterium]|nr:electron transport complex subunit RsxG [Gammaproteobacteria bacterium]
MNVFKNMSISAILLGLFAVLGVGMVSLTYNSTADRIEQNNRNMLLKSLHQLIKPEQHDNDIFRDTIAVTDQALLGSKKPVTIYRARMNDEPVAVIINTIAPDGYSGNIHLLVAIQYDGQLAGVRVVKHRETPGLGDAIEITRSNWILSFNGKSLRNPDKKGWAVKRDGGEFDQFTGATVSPRAIVNAVHNSLVYFKQHKESLFQSNNSEAN